MKYKMMVDVSFTDKLDETIHYQPGDIMKTPVDEKRKENIVTRGLGHIVEVKPENDKAKKKAEEEAAKKLAEEEEAKKKAEEEAAKKKASENPTNEK